MTNKTNFNEGYRPEKVEKGYQPSERPNTGTAQDGYTTTSQKPATNEPPTNPPPKNP